MSLPEPLSAAGSKALQAIINSPSDTLIATDFDGTKAGAIQVGKTTQAQIKAMLGAAPGEAIYPVIKQPNGRALIYNYQEMRGFTPSTKTLTVVLDPQGTVADVDYKDQGTWK